MNARNDDCYQTTDLDEGEQARKNDQFQNAPGRHGSQQGGNDHDDETLRQIDELLNIAG